MNKYSQYVNTEELKKARKKNNVDYLEMAKILGFKSPISYYNIEVGIVEPKISQMLKISSFFRKPVSFFFNLKLQKS